jgi:hypothetical protein
MPLKEVPHGLDATREASPLPRLDEAPDGFVIADVRDAGSARRWLPTRSGASARWQRHARRGALAQARVIYDTTDLLISADLEKDFGDTPKTVTEAIRLAAEAGLVGCSIEDARGNSDATIFELGHADGSPPQCGGGVGLPLPFTLIGRTENFLRGRTDFDDTIERLQAFEAGDADALMGTRPAGLESVRGVCAATSKPFAWLSAVLLRGMSLDMCSTFQPAPKADRWWILLIKIP